MYALDFCKESQLIPCIIFVTMANKISKLRLESSANYPHSLQVYNNSVVTVSYWLRSVGFGSVLS